jgi:hypothetical protein
MRLPIVLVAVALSFGSLRAAAQEPRPAHTEPGRPTYGIVRKAPPKSTQTPPAKPTPEPVKLAPVASTEAVAAAIAAAVRSVEERKKPESPRPSPVRPPTPRVPQRRYAVQWPSQRLQVQWDTPDKRITLSWASLESPTAYAQDDRALQP